MKDVPGNNRTIIFSSLFFMMFSSHVSAGCSRDDVEFYLAKGFSNDQITELCSTPSGAGNEVSSPQSQNTRQESATVAADANTLFLNRAIRAKKIDLSDESLQYTLEVCIEYGEEDLFGFTPKTCPDVTFMISLKDLKVLDTGKKYGFYGTPEVRVKGVIKREIIGNLEDQKPEDRELIMEKFEKGGKTAIPIREDFSLEQVKQVLQEIAR